MNEEKVLKCPSCGYERQPKDDGFIPASECPKCGIIYSKARKSTKENIYIHKVPRETQDPPRPSIDETAQFIEWMIRYHESMEYLRKMLAPKVFEGLVSGMTKDMMCFLEKYNSAAKLMERLSLASELYQKLQPILKKRNNDLNQCSQEIQLSFIDITTKMSLIPYFLKYKYGDDAYFDIVGLKKL